MMQIPCITSHHMQYVIQYKTYANGVYIPAIQQQIYYMH